jgi:hypothetical protein
MSWVLKSATMLRRQVVSWLRKDRDTIKTRETRETRETSKISKTSKTTKDK